MIATRITFAFLCVCTQACSFLAVSAPPSDPVQRDADAAERCTSSVLAPVGDTAWAVVGGAMFIGAVTDPSHQKERFLVADLDRGERMAVGAVDLALFGSAAVYGYIQTARCRSLQDEVARKSGASWSPAKKDNGDENREQTDPNASDEKE